MMEINIITVFIIIVFIINGISILKVNKSVLAVLLFCFFASLQFSYGQILEEDQQEIIKEFEAQLEDAEMVVVKPVVQPVVKAKKSYNYDITIIPLELKYPDPVIKPLAADPDLPFETKPLYLKLGYGNLKNPTGRLMYYKTDQNKTDFYVDLNHYALDNQAKVKHQKMSKSSALLGLNLRAKENMVVALKVDGAYDARKFYFNQSDAGNNFGKNRNKLNGGANLEIYNPEETSSGLDYKISGGYALVNFSGADKKTELIPNAHVMLAKALGKWKISLPITARGTLQSDIDDLYTLDISPSVKMSTEKLWLTAGASVYNDAQLKNKIWPLIHADFTLNNSHLHLFVDAGQKWMMNNLQNLSLQNPWISTSLPSLTSNLMQTASAGVKSENNYLGLEAEIGYAKIHNQASFINPNFQSLEKAELDLINTNSIFIKSSIDFALSNNIEIGGKIIKHFFTETLYGIPSLELTANSKMSFLRNKLVLKPFLTIRDKSIALVRATSDVFDEKKLNNQVDLSAEAEINFSKKVALYLQANNVLNNLYAPQYGYPVVGIHFQGGFVFRI